MGDLLEVAFSIRHADPLLQGRASALVGAWDATPVARMRLEARWPASLPLRWRESAGLPPLRRTEAGGVSTAVLELDDVAPPVLPAHAPARFLHGLEIEFTTFGDWKDVVSVMAPLYAKAAEIGPQSAVADEARRIAAASSSPKARTLAALQLVQGQVRYLAHVEAAGGYTPQTADETWRLRYGDCKAKTALLLALLHQLGIAADPVLVSTTAGDGLDARLPSVQLFDHVLVRVRLDGRDYWLDGTRQGDRDLDEAPVPAFGWVLPLSPGDSHLVRIGPAPATRPQLVQVIRYDASAGVTAPEPTRLETVFRGDAAVAIHNQLAATPPDRVDALLRAYWAGVHTAFTPAHLAAAWDPATGEERLTADGSSKLDWSGAGLELQHVELGGAPDIKRDPAAIDPDAPYLVDFPSYIETDESVVLPPGDVIPPAAMKAADLDEVIGGVAYHRSATLSGGVFRVVASVRALQPEIPAAEARRAADRLAELGKQGVYAPAGVQAQAANDATALDSHPTTAGGHVDRGNALINARRYQEALAEFDAAIALDPRMQLAWADRAVAHAWLTDPTAKSDADTADALGRPEIVAARARGLLAERSGDPAGARVAYTHALALAPGDAFALSRRAQMELVMRDFAAAGADLDAMVKAHPEQAGEAHLTRAKILAVQNLTDAALSEIDKAPAGAPGDLLARARSYAQLKQVTKARADVDAAIKITPTPDAYLLRAQLDGADTPAGKADVAAAAALGPDDRDVLVFQLNSRLRALDYAGAMTVIDKLLQQMPKDAALRVGRAELETRLGKAPEARADLAAAHDQHDAGAPSVRLLCSTEVSAQFDPAMTLDDCDRAVKAAPGDPSSLVMRAITEHRLNRLAAATADIDAAVAAALAKGDAMTLNNACYTMAEADFDLPRALELCDASLKLEADAANTLDSRGFVLLRMGRDAEARAAFDAALGRNPGLAASLYGRALAEARLGRTSDSARDRAAALALESHIDRVFADMGVR